MACKHMHNPLAFSLHLPSFQPHSHHSPLPYFTPSTGLVVLKFVKHKQTIYLLCLEGPILMAHFKNLCRPPLLECSILKPAYRKQLSHSTLTTLQFSYLYQALITCEILHIGIPDSPNYC